MGIQIKKFQAPTLQKAIEQVRTEMGDNAIILQTEPIKTSGGNFLSRNTIEVTAAIDRSLLPARFHATVGEEKEERSGKSTSTTSSTEAAKGWKSLFSKKPTTTTPAVAPAPTSAKAQATQRVAERAAQIAKAASMANPLSGGAGAESRSLGGADAPQDKIGQVYAMKTMLEPLQKELNDLKAQVGKPAEGPKMPTVTTAAGRKRVFDPLEGEVQRLRKELTHFMNGQKYGGAKLPGYFQKLKDYWAEKGMSNRQVLQFFKDIEDWGSRFDETTTEREALDQILTTLEGRVAEAHVSEKTQKRIVVLVGPTGVGKTTTIAKLAAYEKLRRGRGVALVTLDDYKIGGTDQLGHYARILETPFLKFRSDVSLDEQMRLMKEDTIFIDTFGVSPKETDRIEMLKNALQFKDPELRARVEIHLVLPVGISTLDVEAHISRFEELRPQYLLFTKWDETENWGGMLMTILESKKPVSFIGHGQAVPDDLSVFSKKSFIDTVTALSDTE